MTIIKASAVVAARLPVARWIRCMKGTFDSTSNALPQVNIRVKTGKKPRITLLAKPIMIALGVEVLAFWVSSAIELVRISS
jgi:hypothetical protein